MSKKIDPKIAEAEQLVAAIRPWLAHRAPEVVGGALAELVAIFIAGHHPEMRDEQLRLLFDCARDLVDPTVGEMIEAGTAPPEWRATKH